MKLIKGHRYSFKSKNKIRSGYYLGEYFNKVTQTWFYHIEICYGMYWTPEKTKTKVLIKMEN